MDLGDRHEDSVIDFAFTTRDADGLPTALSSGAISVYKANGTTESTAGVTLSASFDSVTGLNHVRIDTSADAFYAVANDYIVVLTAGTVDSVSVVGEVVATFSIENRNRKANVTHWKGNVPADLADTDKVSVSLQHTGSVTVAANVTQVSGDATAADTLELFAEALDQSTGQLDAGSLAAGTITAATFAADVDAEILSYLVDDATRIDATALNTATVTSIPAILVDTAALNDTKVPDTISLANINAQVNAAIETYHLDHLLAVAYDPASKPGAADALLNELVESDGGVSRFTVNALENAPSGSGASAETIADAVWDELLSGHTVSGSTGEALSAAGSGADAAAIADAVWDEAQSGHVGAGTFGEIATEIASILADTNELQTDWADGGRLDLILDARASQTSVDDVPTNSELEARTLAAASYATAANQGTIITHLTDVKGATFDGATDSLESIRNRGDAAWVTATGFSTLDAAGVRTAVGLASANLDTQLGDLPTNAELATALAAADDAVLAAIAALNNLSEAQVNAQVLDVLSTDTFAEPSGAPPATATLAVKLGYLYMALRNKVTVSSSAKTFHDDGGAAEWSKTLSDDGTTYTEDEGS